MAPWHHHRLAVGARVTGEAYDVEILEVVSGATAHVQETGWGEGSAYRWTDGNMGCDCNRALEFWRAKHPGATLEEEPEVPCGHGAYRVTIRVGGVEAVTRG